MNSTFCRSSVSFRAILIGLLLIIPNNYFAIRTNLPATSSLIYTAVFNIFILSLLNILIKRIIPDLAFNQGEIATIYVMLCASTVMVAHDFMRVMGSVLTHGFWYATPENEWKELFWDHIPSWLTNNEKDVISGIYEGESSLYISYSKAIYFFAGLILGDCIVGGTWDIIGVIRKIPIYTFGLG